MHRACPYIILVALMASGWLLLEAGAQPSLPPMARELLCRALHCQADELVVKPAEAARTAKADRFRVERGDDTFFVTSAATTGGVSILRTSGGLAATEDIGLSAAREVATALFHQVVANVDDRMRLISQKQLPVGGYLFVWRQECAPDVATGDVTTIILDGDGALKSLSRRHVMRTVDLQDIKIDRPTALETGARIATKRAGEGVRVVLRQSLLVLSSPLTVDQGPLWQLTYQVGSDGRLPDILVLIDAMSGAEVYPVWSAQPGAQ